ncbi:hypothetical protein PSA5_08495 [Pseudomonas syringae pv. actinidiae]|nr:hypothetical protein PSA5_08495 [Pseudomonas syringae pv. actinidiae]
MHYRLKEGALIAFGALCLYLMMALLTYDQSDPGWSHTSSNAGQVQNAAGWAGAFCADILFMILGYFATYFRCCWRSRPGRCFVIVMNPGSGAAGYSRGA